MIEEWRAIPGWDGLYEVSSFGRVRSIRRLSRINSCTPERKRWMGGGVRKLNALKDGYLGVTLTADGRRESFPVHRAVLCAFKRLPADGEVARHLNGNPADNRPDNLEWGTHAENMKDRLIHGRYLAGEKHAMAKLTNESALEIYHSEEPGTVLAKRYGVSPTKISDIRRGRTWKRVTGGVPRPARSIRSGNGTELMQITKNLLGVA